MVDPQSCYLENPARDAGISWYNTPMLIPRPMDLKRLTLANKRSRVTALVGPRQCGKTTLMEMYTQKLKDVHVFDLEDPASIVALDEPMTVLKPLRGIIVIDEIQRRPDLFPVLRVLSDRRPLPAKFIILGSAAPELLRQSSESLAGRIEYVELSGISLKDIQKTEINRHWLRGGFPPALLAASDEDSFTWKKQFVQTFLERDLPALGIRIPSTTLYRFWSMLAHYHANIWNAAEIARSLGVNESTTRRYLDILESLYMVRVLTPWHANIKKRQIKSPKIIFRDTGILHSLLGIRTTKDLLNHPKSGASWEGLVIEQVIHIGRPDEFYFWGTHGGSEIDLILRRGEKWIGIECKRKDAPKITPSIRNATRDLNLDAVYVIYPGTRHYRLDETTEVVPLQDLVAKNTIF